MYIKLKIEEIDKTIFERNIPDHEDSFTSILEDRILLEDSTILNGVYNVYHTNGLCITDLNFKVLQTCTNSKIVQGEYIQISLLVKGRTDILRSSPAKNKNVLEGIVQWVYVKDADTKIKLPQNDENLRYFRFYISKTFYLQLLKHEEWTKNDPFYGNVQKSKYMRFGENYVPLTNNILEVFIDITDNTYKGVHKNMYIESKLKELFLLLHINNSEEVTSVNLKEEEFAKLKIAKAHLQTYYKSPPSIKDLSKIVFLNELKLKKGFKDLYGISIHQYVIKIRMEEAQKLLLKKTKINEVSFLVGYKNPSHFILTFKKYYGFTPTKKV